MSRQHHTLKTETQYYQDSEEGIKTFEIRENDHNFQLYDMITLEETVNGVKTGRQLGPLEINYIVYSPLYGLKEGYCIFTFKR